MKKIIIGICFSLICISVPLVTTASAQTAYGISIVAYDDDIRIVEGYSGTWLDYYAGVYYDPEVIGDLYRTDMNETSLDSGRHFGYADIVPAEIYLSTTNYVEGRTYCTFSQHAVWGYFYYIQSGQWFDPFRYSTFFNNPPSPWSGYPFSYFYAVPRRYYLGYTQACITIPLPPPPTPTPTPDITPTPPPPPVTPTPTPTPCDDGLGSNCQVPQVQVHIFDSPRPTGTTGGGNVARVRTCIVNINNPAGRPVRLQLINPSSATQIDAGHKEDHHSGRRPLGKLARTQGTTDAQGCFETTYAPSHISGHFQVRSTIADRSAGTNGAVIFPELHTLLPGGDYRLIGTTISHPSNHWGTLQAKNSLVQIASDYKTEFYGNNPIPEDEKVAFNDMSLEWGGKFDLKNGWSNRGAHIEHREGINCDTRSSNIPRNRWVRLNRIFFENGSTDTHDETGTNAPHWHLRFLYGSSHAAAERTPHIFVEDVFNAVLSRESTQDEYELWLGRVSNAKAVGQSELLLAAKNLEIEVFVSGEYIARNRSNYEFISDVFWAHLFREPTEIEIQEWTAFLQNLPPFMSDEMRRESLIGEFQQGTEFQDIVFGIVDAPAPTQ